MTERSVKSKVYCLDILKNHVNLKLRMTKWSFSVFSMKYPWSAALFLVVSVLIRLVKLFQLSLRDNCKQIKRY